MQQRTQLEPNARGLVLLVRQNHGCYGDANFKNISGEEKEFSHILAHEMMKLLVFKTNYRLMQVKSIAECTKGSILQYFRPSLSYLYHLS